MKALLALLVVASVGVASVAAADAIPPPPENCPEGSTPVSSHSGTGCKLNPPTNCPSGWRGMLGGVSVLVVAEGALVIAADSNSNERAGLAEKTCFRQPPATGSKHR